jgi:glycosyltransferase involved in cell wall biosynthesis
VKLIIQIPCYNEEAILAETLAVLPKSISGFDCVEFLVIDDGSEDKTVEVAEACGVDHIIRLQQHQGLGRAFINGLEACLRLGADVIVNTDADNQYSAEDIPNLLQPILNGEADFVIGTRPIRSIDHFSWIKKCLQKLGSRVVRAASQTAVMDAPSGFRAITRKAAMQLNVFSSYSYTLETLIQAGHAGISTVSVPVRVNSKQRPSRLVSSLFSYVQKSALTIIRTYAIYRPLEFFFGIAALFFLPGLILSFRFLYYFLTGDGDGHVQSVILSVFLMSAGFSLVVIAILAELISVNRQLLEKIGYYQQLIEAKIDKGTDGFVD